MTLSIKHQRHALSLFILCLAVGGCAVTERAAHVKCRAWCPDNGDGTFTNPLMWGDWPDPDIIRVGDDFYFTSTSMHYVPGCPIAHSKDLVNWEMAGYAVPRYDEDPRWDMNGGQLYLQGAWATTLRHHNGKFYLGFCTPNWGKDKGHFSMCVAEDIRGPWNRTIFPEYLYDPGLFFDDDGKVYVVHGQGTLYVTELAADALSVRKPGLKIWSGGFDAAGNLVPPGGKAPFGLEGSHVYKVNGKYYLTCPGGGTEGFQICLRSDNIYGPYECKRICRDDSSYPRNGLHQGGMVQLKNGDWWFVIMQDRGPIGRVPHLVPVTWVDGWPMLGNDGEGKGVLNCKKPDVGAVHPFIAPATTDEFNTARLGLQWQWNHNPDPEKWSLTERPGWLRLKAARAENLTKGRNTLTQRVQGPVSEGIVEMDVRGLKDGDVAGFGIFESPYAFIAVQQEGGDRRIVMVNNGKTIATVENFHGECLWIKARATHVGFKADFEYSTDGKSYQPLGNKLRMGLGLAWTANRFALFNYSTKDTGVGGYADFDYFRLSMDYQPPPG
jgi:beta-xylosidase